MRNKEKFGLVAMVLIAFIAILTMLVYGNDISVLNPKGGVAAKERDLIIFGTVLSLIIIVPVFTMTFVIAWKYREGNKKAKYQPDWDHSKLFESIWWGVPLILIIILSVVTWKSSHELDPFKPLQAEGKPLRVQVVALQWKWLFIYPEQNIATVNYVQFPEDTPINFEVTSDAPMNSFWIPSLGGQIYAMSGMVTKLHLIADQTGEYRGSSANISGRGFSGMKFVAEATTSSAFEDWVRETKKSSKKLGIDEYSSLSEPSENNPAELFVLADTNLFDYITHKFTINPGISYEAGP
ncbi:MAG TPA: ubiquinol oxidase subunit II [Candidatus Saccharimonadales bacterium]|nr:ubiquinol oxidase subunit II [Candidatus Saccharimonadales bacterium]